MNFLLMAGLGPYYMYNVGLKDTLFSPNGNQEFANLYSKLVGQPIDLKKFRYQGNTLLRPYRGTMPSLTMETVRSILDTTTVDYEIFDLEDLWNDSGEPDSDNFDIVGLSTSFICDKVTLKRVIDWITSRYPQATLILGGQYSNIKYGQILHDHQTVDYIIRGDAEHALPLLLRALQGKAELSDVPNLVIREESGRLYVRPYDYIDLEAHPSPTFHGAHHTIPYESMRGCPFFCKYCSFPAASPKWRYKSVQKIVDDWRTYKEVNNAQLIRAQDSTFTIPPPRFRGLLEALPALNVKWEGYTRANSINSAEIVEQLEASGCQRFFIGFESMSDRVLKFMDKRVSAAQNKRAIELLANSQIVLRGSFIVGYPGETPEDFALTQDYLVNHYRGRFGMHVFLLVDETMPVWQDAEMHQLQVFKNGTWQHKGMDLATAGKLRERTLFEARWQNDESVNEQWQLDFTRPLAPDQNVQQNIKIEKLIERLAFLYKDWGSDETAVARGHAILDKLNEMGVYYAAEPALGSNGSVSPETKLHLEATGD